ncbi:MAG: cell envelope integrity protein CreD [Lentilitoribacter sp.]
MSDTQELPNPSPMANQRPSFFSGLSSSPGFKFIITGIITFLLFIPALLVWALVEERANRADQVAQSISQGWGNQQRINGPYLVIPYLTKQKQNDVYVDVRRYAIFSPTKLETTSELEVEERKKSIYSTPLYHMKSQLIGSFENVDTAQIVARNGRPRLREAFLAIEVSDLAGFRSEVVAKLNDGNADIFSPGLAGLAPSSSPNRYSSPHIASKSSGIHLDVDETLLDQPIKFEIDLTINGSRALEIVPSGKTTHVSMTSNWPHPGFNGRFLPETRNITETGFDAKWTVPNLARGISAVSFGHQMSNANSIIEVSFVKPLKFYQLVSRTLKYAVAFFSLVFLAIFILELTGKNSVHWIQYILTGLAMVVFYILLLALAEQVGFDIAYTIASIATTGLIAWYVGNALSSRNAVYVLASVVGLTYAIMYLILKEDEYALLIGAIIAFAAIALTMFATRNVDWSRNANKTISS